MDAQVRAIAVKRAEMDLLDRREQFPREVAKIHAEMSARGALHSGMTIRRVRDVADWEYRIRADLVWRAIARALSEARTRLAEDLATEVKVLVRTLVSQGSSDIPQEMDRTEKLLGGRAATKYSTPELMNRALNRIDNEVDYAVLRSTNVTEAEGHAVNIYQSYGIVQMGSASTASMAVTIGASEKEALQAALDEVQRTLEDAESLSTQTKGETLDLVSELRTELEKDAPNGIRIRSMLQGVATTVQTLASAPKAYQLLKGVAGFIGLDLP